MSRTLWFVAILGAIASAYVIPYGFLNDVVAFSGAFLFWTVFAAVVAGLIWWGTADWRDTGAGDSR